MEQTELLIAPIDAELANVVRKYWKLTKHRLDGKVSEKPPSLISFF